MRLSNLAAKIIFATAAIVLLSISYILYQQIRNLLRSQEQLNVTNLVKLKLEGTLSTLKDAENAQRGFLLTKDSLFLQPYYGAYERSQSLLSQLRNLTEGDEQQQRYLNALQTFIEVRFKTFNHVINEFDNPQNSPQAKNMYLMRRATAMDSIHHYMNEIEGREEAIVYKREQLYKKYNFLTPLFGVLLMVTAIGILIFSYLKIIEQLNKSKKLLFQLKKLNYRLKKKNHKLQLYNKELDSFTYIASHDLKEPIRKILTYTTLIENDEEVNFSERSQNHFKRIKHAAFRMKNLLNDLLLYSHINMADKSFERVDLNKVVDDVIVNLHEEIEETNTHIKKKNLPVIHGMPFQIKQLFENLVLNSIKYKQDNLDPHIIIENTLINKKDITEKFPKSSNQYYKLLFSDNGIGFEQVYSDKVFQLFQRLHNRTNKPGTGIGLTICKKIVDNHNGFIKAVSEVNKGTTFVIYLPVI
jgi:signal transduction histidine kinase